MMLRIIHASIYTTIVALTAPVTAATERLPPFFYCKSKSDKTLELYKQNNTISYKFGHPGRTPDLELNGLVDEVYISIGNATGSELSNSVTLPMAPILILLDPQLTEWLMSKYPSTAY